MDITGDYHSRTDEETGLKYYQTKSETDYTRSSICYWYTKSFECLYMILPIQKDVHLIQNSYLYPIHRDTYG